MGAEAVLGSFGKYFDTLKLILVYQNGQKPGETMLSIKTLSFWLDFKWNLNLQPSCTFCKCVHVSLCAEKEKRALALDLYSVKTSKS